MAKIKRWVPKPSDNVVVVKVPSVLHKNLLIASAILNVILLIVMLTII